MVKISINGALIFFYKRLVNVLIKELIAIYHNTKQADEHCQDWIYFLFYKSLPMVFASNVNDFSFVWVVANLLPGLLKSNRITEVEDKYIDAVRQAGPGIPGRVCTYDKRRITFGPLA